MTDIDYVHEVTHLIKRPNLHDLEFYADVVSGDPELVDLVMVRYRASGSQEQRAAAVYLLPDRFEPDYHPILLDYVGSASPAVHDTAHIALAKALCVLEEDWGAYDRYWDDLDAAVARGRQLAAEAPEGGMEAAEDRLVVVPGERVGAVRFGMSRQEVTAAIGDPDTSKTFGDEVTLTYSERGIDVDLKEDSVWILTVQREAIARGGVVVRHPRRRDATVALPVSVEALIEAWGEPSYRSRSSYREHLTILSYSGLAFQFLEEDGSLARVRMSV